MKYCPLCGEAFPDTVSWPRRCQACGRDQFRNPIPVSVVLVPVDDGVLTVRRAIPPAAGGLALPGGFVNWGESWREAGVREVFEETGLQLEPRELTLLAAESVAEGALLLFSEARRRSQSECLWRPDPQEVSEIVVVQAPCELAFPTHTAQLTHWFSQQNGR